MQLACRAARKLSTRAAAERRCCRAAAAVARGPAAAALTCPACINGRRGVAGSSGSQLASARLWLAQAPLRPYLIAVACIRSCAQWRAWGRRSAQRSTAGQWPCVRLWASAVPCCAALWPLKKMMRRAGDSGDGWPYWRPAPQPLVRLVIASPEHPEAGGARFDAGESSVQC